MPSATVFEGSSMASAKATPDAGQTADANPGGIASFKPINPAK